MEPVMMANVGVVALNALLLSALLVLFGRMTRQVPTAFTWGLLAFAGVLWIQSVVQLYFFATMMAYYAGGVENLVLAQNVLATLASLFLTYVTFSPSGLGSKGKAPTRDA